MSKVRAGASRDTLVPIFLALFVASVIYAFALEEEPYHIDELRQTRAYDQPVGQVIDAAFAQDQPPLDPVLNSLVQRIIGVGDWKQRLLPAISGLAAMGLLALLLFRSGMIRGGPAFAVLAMAGSALLTSVFVYARPYALPSLLMLAFLLAANVWVRERRKWAAVLLFLLALMLPLSRTLEPLLLLGVTAGVLVLYRVLVRRKFEGSISVPIAAAAAGIVITGVPVITRLRAQLGGYTQGDQGSIGDRLERLVTDVPHGLARAFPFWPLLLALVVLVLFSESARRWLKGNWWAWVLIALPISFTVGFVISVDPTQPLYDRYFFTWVPVIAVFAALGWENRSTIFRFLPAVAVSLLLVWMAWTQYKAFTTNDNGDWRALSATIEDMAPPDAVVVVEHTNPLGGYRPFYYGQPRYLPWGWSTHSPLDLIRDPARADRPGPLVVALSGPDVSVDGWRSVPVDEFFTLYLNDGSNNGPVAIAEGLAAFSKAVGYDNGATLGAAAASVYMSAGLIDRACEIIGSIQSTDDLTVRLERVLEAQTSPLLQLECPTEALVKPVEAP